MKKIIVAVLLIAGSFSFANAQTVKKTTNKKEKTTAVASKTTASTPANLNSGNKKVEKSTSVTTHLKADGSADKRYKENKVKTTTSGPLKKDGTADKRYKANKK